jgi:hypothetical protein
MSNRVSLQHPAGKKAVSMNAERYELLRRAITTVLANGTSLPHAALLAAVERYLKEEHLSFTGSLAWHLEWVKLDMEARAALLREKTGRDEQYRLP